MRNLTYQYTKKTSMENTFEGFTGEQFTELLKTWIERRRGQPVRKIIQWREYYDTSEEATTFEVKFRTWMDDTTQTYHVPLWGLIGYIFSISKT